MFCREDCDDDDDNDDKHGCGVCVASQRVVCGCFHPSNEKCAKYLLGWNPLDVGAKNNFVSVNEVCVMCVCVCGWYVCVCVFRLQSICIHFG